MVNSPKNERQNYIKNYQLKSPWFLLMISIIFSLTMLLSTSFSSYTFAINSNSNSSTSNNDPNSYVYLSNVPALSIHQGNNVNNTLEPVLTRYMDIFNPSINGSKIHIVNSNFTLNNKSYNLSPGSNLETLFNNSSKYFFTDVNGFHIVNVTIKLANILNPLQTTDIQNMHIGNITTLPLTNDDNGQYRHFLIPSNISLGYYLLNVISNTDNYNNSASPVQNIKTVYTAKAIITSNKMQLSNNSLTNMTNNVGINNNPSNTLGIQNNPSFNIGINPHFYINNNNHQASSSPSTSNSYNHHHAPTSTTRNPHYPPDCNPPSIANPRTVYSYTGECLLSIQNPSANGINYDMQVTGDCQKINQNTIKVHFISGQITSCYITFYPKSISP